MGSEPIFGYLTSATRLEPGRTFHSRGVRKLRAESEVAVELGGTCVRPMTPRPSAPRSPGSPRRSNSSMSIPRWMALRGSSRTTRTIERSPSARPGRSFRDATCVYLPGQRGDPRLGQDVGGLRREACGHRGQLEAVGEKLRAGDRIITGSLTHVPVRAGDAIEISIAPLGSLAIQIVD